MKNGSIAKAWNESVVSENKEYQPRDYLWASDLGKADIDTFLAMKGEQPTNRPDIRSLRKFDMGNILEGVVAKVLDRSGIVKWLPSDEKRVYGNEPGCLKVSGRFDILLDGKPDFEKAKVGLEKELKALLGKVDDPYQEYILRKSINMANYYLEKDEKVEYTKVITEVKSMALYTFNMVEESNEPIDAHVMQTYHYVAYNKINASKTARLFCLSKDDTRLLEFGISGGEGSRYREMYLDAVRRKSQFYQNDEMPPKEPMLVFERGQLRTNVIKVGYSGYLTKLYGYKHTEEYRDDWGKKATAWNRVIKRVVDGENVTANNLEKIDEMTTHFGEDGYENIIKKARKASQKAYAMGKKKEGKAKKEQET